MGFHPATVGAFFNPPVLWIFKICAGNSANKSLLLAGVKWVGAWRQHSTIVTDLAENSHAHEACSFYIQRGLHPIEETRSSCRGKHQIAFRNLYMTQTEMPNVSIVLSMSVFLLLEIQLALNKLRCLVAPHSSAMALLHPTRELAPPPANFNEHTKYLCNIGGWCQAFNQMFFNQNLACDGSCLVWAEMCCVALMTAAKWEIQTSRLHQKQACVTLVWSQSFSL